MMIITEDEFVELSRTEILNLMRQGCDFSQVSGDILGVYAPISSHRGDLAYYLGYLLWRDEANLSYENKEDVVSILLHLEEGREWAYQNFKGDKLILLHNTHPLSGKAAVCSAKNPYHTARSVLKVIQTCSTQYTIARFIKHTPDELWTEEFTREIIGAASSRLKPEVLARRLRPIYNLDKSLPDNWVLKVLGGSTLV